jgi:hypothetical protein
MRVVRDHRGWDPGDALDPEAESVLAFLDDLSARGALPDVDEVVARIDEYGVVKIDVPVSAASLFLQAGDGWDRVIWTTRRGRAYEWQWDAVRGPSEVSALVEGRGVERLTYWGRRRLAAELVVDGDTLACSGGLLRGPLQWLGLAVAQRHESAL